MALFELDSPVEIGGCVLLKVKVLAEGRRQTFVEAFLVEVEAGLEGCGSAG